MSAIKAQDFARLEAAGRKLDAVAQSTEAQAGPPFAVVPVSNLLTDPPAAPTYLWDDYLPAGVVTLLGAHGGTGKSLLALMLAVCTALGLPMFGLATRRSVVVYFSAEDGVEVLRYRLAWVCRVLGVNPADLRGRLHLLDAASGDPTLFHEVGANGRRVGVTTPAYTALRAYVEQHHAGLLIVDNASDAFDASEIDRARVRGFMRALAQIARAAQGAVLLLAHVDKGTSRGDRTGSEGYSGSTAWHNSSRSRLYLSRGKDGALLLEHQKQQHGRQRAPLRLIWPVDALPMVDAPMQPVVQRIADRNHACALLRLIAEFSDRGEYVSTATTSRSNAPTLLGGQPTFPNLKSDEVFDLLRGSERAGHLRRFAYKGGDRKARERWEVTPDGRRAAGLAATAATAATPIVAALTAEAAEPAATAATPHRGVWGESARTEPAATPPAESIEKPGASGGDGSAGESI